MKIMNSKSAAAALILAASVIPAFGQSRGHGSDRGATRSGHAQFEQQRSFQAPAGERGSQRGDSFRNRAVPQSEQRYQPERQQRQFTQGQPAYRPQNRSAYRASGRYVIPQSRFSSSFGRDHFFRIGRPAFYGRYPRFQYGGFWFSFAGAAPAYWGPDWYDSDDVYIDYSDGGYYLFDNRYPGQGIPLDADNGDASSAAPDSAYDGSHDDGYGEPYPGTY